MYYHNVHYYETDKMGITHHSNYVRWMEEARIDFLDKLGYGYERLEEEGIISPVVSVSCDYKKTSSFPDRIAIDVRIEEFKGVKLKLSYTMKNEKDELVCQAGSVHCFLNEKGRPISLKREKPELYKVLIEAMEKE